VKLQLKAILIFLFSFAFFTYAQSVPEDQSPIHETQIRGYWIDPSTGLMWAGKDNGKDVNWRQAAKYCRNLRLAGYSDWRLPTIDELEGIYDESVRSPGLIGQGKKAKNVPWHVKGNIFLTGRQWSTSQIMRDHG